MTGQEHQEEGGSRSRGILRAVWISIEYIAYHIAKAFGENLRTMRKEMNLFLGAALTVLGMLNWSTGKYCDGNTADYLSCTRPTAYYYYSWFSVTLVLIGVLLVLVWFVRNRKSK